MGGKQVNSGASYTVLNCSVWGAFGGQASKHRRTVHRIELQCMGGIWGASE